MITANELVEHDVLTELLAYDRLTGVFTWSKNRGRTAKIGRVAGSTGNRGYILIEMSGHCYTASRLAWFYVHGTWPNGVIDHIDGDRQNNRINNLREVSRAQNAENRSGKSSNRTGLLGVSVSTGRKPFRAIIHTEGKQVRLGRFETALEAHEVYLAAKARIHTGMTSRATDALGGDQ